MIPEEGVNAIARLCLALKAIGIELQGHQFYRPGDRGEYRTPRASLASAPMRLIRQAQVQCG